MDVDQTNGLMISALMGSLFVYINTIEDQVLGYRFL
jgi:hypothetical protein